MPKAYLAVVRNHFLGNNSGKTGRIGTKFFAETSTQVAWCLRKVLAPYAKRSRIGGKNYYILRPFSSPKQRMASPT